MNTNVSPLMLTIDVGTQSLRVGLVNKQGNLEAFIKEKYEPAYISRHKGEAVQHPDFYFDVIVSALTKLKEKYSNLYSRIIGMTLDTVRDTSVILDENFKPLHDTIIWLDQRLASGSMKHRPKFHKVLFKLIGMMPTMELNFKKSISLWYRENRPEIWSQMKHFGNISSYLTYKITGEWKDSSASIIGHYPLDFKHRCYYKSDRALKNLSGIPLTALPKLVQPGEVIAKITNDFASKTGLPEGLPLYAVGSDKACESIGVGALTTNVAAISYGTASTIEVTVNHYKESQPFLPAYPSAIPNYFNMDVQIYRGYWMINWFLENFCRDPISNVKVRDDILKHFNREMLKIPAGSDGLILQPYWQPGLERPLARGAMIGFTDTHTSVHFYRAIIEGIAFALREALEYFEKKNHQKVEEIMVSGGGSQSDEICQITADIFGVPVSRVQTFETSLLGAGVAGFLAAKEFNNPQEAIQAMVHKSRTFTPNMDSHALYNEIFNLGYKKMYPQLSPIYKHSIKFSDNKK